MRAVVIKYGKNQLEPSTPAAVVRLAVRNYRVFTSASVHVCPPDIIKFAFRFHANAYMLTYFIGGEGHVHNSHVNSSLHGKLKYTNHTFPLSSRLRIAIALFRRAQFEIYVCTGILISHKRCSNRHYCHYHLTPASDRRTAAIGEVRGGTLLYIFMNYPREKRLNSLFMILCRNKLNVTL